MNLAAFSAIVPMACVTAAAHRRDDRRGVPRAAASGCRSARSASSGLSARRCRTALLWNRDADRASASSSADNFGLFVTGVLVIVGMLSLAHLGADARARTAAARASTTR